MTPVSVPAWLRTGSNLAARSLVAAAGLLAVGYLFLKLRIVTVPAFAALLVATVVAPPAAALRRRGWRPALATWAVLGPALLGVVGGVALLVPVLAEQFADVGDRVDEGIVDLERRLTDAGYAEIDLRQSVEDAVDGAVAEGVSDEVVSGVTLVGELLAGVLLVVVMAFFFVKDSDKITAWAIGHVRPDKRGVARRAGDAAWRTISGYVRGTAVVGLVDAVVIGVGLAVIGVPLVLPLAVLTFAGAFIPLIGATVAGGVAALVALVTGGPTDALLVVGVTVLVQQIEGDVVAPLVMGRALKLHPLVILVAVTAGAVVAGILGAFLAVPLTAVVVAVVAAIREEDPAVEEPGQPADPVLVTAPAP
jgi:predicted PurR-regulated permease PerM